MVTKKICIADDIIKKFEVGASINIAFLILVLYKVILVLYIHTYIHA